MQKKNRLHFSIKHNGQRHYGILSSSLKKEIIPALQEQLGKAILQESSVYQHRVCPKCKKGELVTLMTFKGRAPPADVVLQILQHQFSRVPVLRP